MPSFHIVTLFPAFFDSVLNEGLLGRALKEGIVSVDRTDPRTFSTDRHRHVDDSPYGGSPGMLMKMEPLVRALRSLPRPGRMLAMAPCGRPATQELMRELAREEDITILCGRYEGFDARLYELFSLEPVSVGDLVLNGGETAALVLLEAVSRLVPGFMGKEESGEDESYSGSLLEYPHYTRPPVYEGQEVPAVLLGGDHGAVAAWCREKSLEATLRFRPDLLDGAALARDDAKTLAACPRISCDVRLWLIDEGAPPAWQTLWHRPLADADMAALKEHAAHCGLKETRLLGRDAGAEIAAGLRAVEEETEKMPFLCAVGAWPKKQLVLGPAELRRKALEVPLVLLAGSRGWLRKETLHLVHGCARPVRFLDGPGALGCREMLVMLLDRVLGDWLQIGQSRA